MRPSKSIDDQIAHAIEARDIAALDRLLEEFVKPGKEADAAFTPALELASPRRRATVELVEEGVDLGDAALVIANKISRAKRRVAYELKVLGGFSGLRIVSDGDSWFQYPLVLTDIINVLSADEDKAILSLDGAGDELATMLGENEWDNGIKSINAHALLFSAGGNDLLGEGRFIDLLKPFSQSASAHDLIKHDKLERRITQILRDYRKIVMEVGRRHPHVVVLGHGYDVTHPRRRGKWLGKPLEERRIPLPLGREIVGIIIDRFNEGLAKLAEEFSHYRHIDLRGKVDDGAESWHDELHPLDPGYARAADGFRRALAQLARETASQEEGRTWSRVSVASPIVAAPEANSATIVIDPGHGGTRDLPCSSSNNAVGPTRGTLEKTLTLDVAKRVKAIIDRDGVHSCILTRDTDVNVAGTERAHIARRKDAAVFVSIHFNGSIGHNAQGTETFVHTRHADTGASARLCRAVQAAVVRATGLDDRNRRHPHGIKKAGFCVINPASHATKTAAVLVEVSFMDRDDEERRLLQERYRQDIAAAIVEGIQSYLGDEAAPSSRHLHDDVEDAVSLQAHEARIDVREMFDAPKSARSTEERSAHSDWRREAARLFRPDVSNSSWSDDEATDEIDESGEFADLSIGTAPDFETASFDASAALIDTMFTAEEAAGFDFAEFGRYIDSLGLRHFKPIEFLFLGAGDVTGRCAGRNGLPPKSLWPRIGNTARMLDEIRSRLDAPIKILSAYRNEAYNTCIGGERNSFHTRFNAIDWTCSIGTPTQWRDVARAVRASDPDFNGGIGFYPRSRFIHIDTRGRKADW